MAMTPLSRKRVVVAPLMAAMVALASPTVAHAADAPGAADRAVVATTEAVQVVPTSGTGGTRRHGLTIRTPDDIRGAVS